MCTYGTRVGYIEEWREDEYGGMDRGPLTHTCTSVLSYSGGGCDTTLLHRVIFWCLAVVETSVDLVLQGPSASVCLPRDVLSVMDLLSADNLWDDQLSKTAVLMLCGTYQCYTGVRRLPRTLALSNDSSTKSITISRWYVYTACLHVRLLATTPHQDPPHVCSYSR
jgi:hypothetical protein